MKIIKNTMTEPIEVECPNCKSIIAYTYDEIRRFTTYNFLGYETGVKQYVVCPVCKCDIDRTPRVKLIDIEDSAEECLPCHEKGEEE